MPFSPDSLHSSGDAASVGIKAGTRAALLAARRAISPTVRTRADAALRDALVALIRTERPGRLTGYAPLPTEPGGADLPAVLAEAAGPGQLLLPVLRPDLDLDWASYRDAGDLTAAKGVREPVGRRLGVDAIGTADLVIVPAVAVDRLGVRLGRGGGSYDRALARVRTGAPVVAVLYDGELLDRLPAQHHDRPVGFVVTPGEGLLRLPAGTGTNPDPRSP